MGDNNYKKAHKAAGLCQDCSEPAYPDRTRCLKHLLSHVKAQQKYYFKNQELYSEIFKKLKKRRVEKGRCYACGGPLDNRAMITCVNCREQIYRERSYAKSYTGC